MVFRIVYGLTFMLSKTFSTVILAAGKSTRMYSKVPKILHCIGGKFIIQYVIDIAVKIGSKNIYIVYGNDCNKDFLVKTLNIKEHYRIVWVLQSPSCGTGHAVKQVFPLLVDDSIDILILYADVPMLSSGTIYKLFDIKIKGGISLLTAFFKKCNGYGRIIRHIDGNVVNIVEDSDISEDQKMINEINTGIMLVTSQDLKRWVNSIENFNNINHEFYLTDIVNMAWMEGCKINTVLPNENYEVMGVNNKLQLSELERIYQRKQAEYLLSSGVILSDINRFDLRGELNHGYDVYIDVNVLIEGTVFLGNRVNVGMGCIIKNSIIGDDVIIYPYSFIDGSKVHARSVIGPFARLRFGNELGERTVVGNFVELKNTQLGSDSKVRHVSYMGDTIAGKKVNIGAGVIVCNYDGISKHKTEIGDNVFVGADSQLVAPVKIGSSSKIGAGTTVTRDVLSGEMVISRLRQFSITSWNRVFKKKDNKS